MSTALFARYAYPPNELGYCGPPDASVLLQPGAQDRVRQHAEGFAGAWPYLQEIGAACRLSPLDSEVVRSYWVGGPLLDRVDGRQLVGRIRCAMAGQPTGLLDVLPGHEHALAHHSFHVMVVYPWIRFLQTGPGTPLQILQACRIRWGVVSSVDSEHAVIESQPLRFDGQSLTLGPTRPETVRWRRAGTSLSPRPRTGEIVSAHWDWVCEPLSVTQCSALEAATRSTLTLANRLSAPQRGAAPAVSPACRGGSAGCDRLRR